MWLLVKTEWGYQRGLFAFIYGFALIALLGILALIDGSEPLEGLLPGVLMLGSVTALPLAPNLWNAQQREKRLHLWEPLPFSPTQIWRGHLNMILLLWSPSILLILVSVGRYRGDAFGAADLSYALSVCALILAVLLLSRLLFDAFRLKNDVFGQLCFILLMISNGFGRRTEFGQSLYAGLSDFLFWPPALPLLCALAGLLVYLWMRVFTRRRELS